MTRNKSGSLAKCMSPESPRRRTWKWNMSLTLQKVEDLLFFVTLNFPIDTWSARAARWTRARDAFPLPPPLSRILSPNFLCCLRIYQLIRVRVLRSYFDDFRGTRKASFYAFTRWKKWRPHERLSIFSSRIFRFFPITLDLLEQKEKVKMLQNNLLGR